MELTDICPAQVWEDLENDLFKKFNLQGVIFSANGSRVTQVMNWSNDLCRAIKESAKGQSFICSVAHQSMTAEAKKDRTPVVEACDAGLMKILVPVFAKGEFAGVISGCGKLAEVDGEADLFAITKIAGLDPEKIADPAENLPTISETQIQEVINYIQGRLAQILAAHP
jgi:ligand-binding sensor protein